MKKIAGLLLFIVACGTPLDKKLHSETKVVVDKINAQLGCKALEMNNDLHYTASGLTVHVLAKATAKDILGNTTTDIDMAAIAGAFKPYDNIPNEGEINIIEWLLEDKVINDLDLVLVHEIGHGFGLQHEPNSIMNAATNINMTMHDALASLQFVLNEHSVKYCN